MRSDAIVIITWSVVIIGCILLFGLSGCATVKCVAHSNYCN
jgi:hypothetical protein